MAERTDRDEVKRWMGGMGAGGVRRTVCGGGEGHPIEETRGRVPSKVDRERERLGGTMDAAETQGGGRTVRREVKEAMSGANMHVPSGTSETGKSGGGISKSEDGGVIEEKTEVQRGQGIITWGVG